MTYPYFPRINKPIQYTLLFFHVPIREALHFVAMLFYFTNLQWNFLHTLTGTKKSEISILRTCLFSLRKVDQISLVTPLLGLFLSDVAMILKIKFIEPSGMSGT